MKRFRIPKRFKNYVLWAAIASFIGLILQDMGVEIAPERYEKYVDLVLSILVLAGIINNPASGKGFKDE
jgi:uncharacterized membrane protein